MAQKNIDAWNEEPVRKPRKKKKKGLPIGCLIVLVLLAVMVIGALLAVKWAKNEVNGAGDPDTEIEVTVEPGSGPATITRLLKENGVIKSDLLFKLYLRKTGAGPTLQYGTFRLYKGENYDDIIQTLSTYAAAETITVTFPDGNTAVDFARRAEEAGLCTAEEFLECANNGDFSQYDFWNEIPDNPARLMKCEGYLYPETYEFYKDATVYEVVDTFYREFDRRTAEVQQEIKNSGYTLDEVVNLASFIQEEAGIPVENERVSAVFHNRLESSDPLWSSHCLQSNASSYIMNSEDNNYLWNSPTAEYFGWVEAGAIPEDVLAAYDTYRIGGLPAGPICNPGAAAMEAALNPDPAYISEGYYFFVTGHPNSSEPGKYYYAKTADEHNRNCRTAGWY